MSFSFTPFSFSHGISRQQWNVLLAAWFGWMLDAFDFVLYLIAIPALQTEMGFDTRAAGLLATAALLFSAVGGVVFGILSDSVGRTRALIATILLYSIGSLGSATSSGILSLLFWRCLLGLGMGGEWAAGAVLVAESWPAAHRGKAIGIVQSGWAVGYIIATLVAGFLLGPLGWRGVFALGVLPALATLWIRRNLTDALPKKSRKTRAGFPLSRLFAPPWLGTTVIASLVSAFVMFGYWGLFTWMPAFLSSPISAGGAGLGLVKSTGWLVPMQLGALAGYLSFGFLSDLWGRRLIFAVFLVGAALLVPIYGTQARSPILLMLLGPWIGFFGHGYFSLFGSMLAELFPTEIRGTAQGFCYNIGRALSALAPFLIGALATKKGIGPALALTSFFFLVGAGLIALLPETRNRDISLIS